jgi:hypothetical protein
METTTTTMMARSAKVSEQVLQIRTAQLGRGRGPERCWTRSLTVHMKVVERAIREQNICMYPNLGHFRVANSSI